MKNLNKTEYNEMTNLDTLSVIKYFGVWCQPCKMLSPILEGVVKNYTDINVGEVDIDTNMSLAQKDGIRGVPTVVFYKNGKLLDKMVGLQPAQSYIDKINSLSN